MISYVYKRRVRRVNEGLSSSCWKFSSVNTSTQYTGTNRVHVMTKDISKLEQRKSCVFYFPARFLGRSLCRNDTNFVFGIYNLLNNTSQMLGLKFLI